MAESSSSSTPGLDGLAIETVEWLPSGAESGLVRVRGRWLDESARQPELPVLAVRVSGAEHRFDSLPDARFSRDPSSWRGTYLMPAELVATDPEALWLEWPSGARAGLPALSRGVEPPPVPGAAPPRSEVEEPGGEVIDRAVLAERRARRAEAAEQQQSRVAAEALKAVEVLELRSAELERRLEEATAERDALAARDSSSDEHRAALSAALASAAELRARSRGWQLRLRTDEVTRAGDSVRLAVLESERATTAPALRTALADALTARDDAQGEAAAARAALDEARAEAGSTRAALDEAQAAATAARAAADENDGRFAEARAAWERRREELETELTSVRAALDEARAFEAAVAAAEARLAVETVARTTLEDELDRERAARAAERSTADDLRRDLELARANNDGLRAELFSAQDAAAAAAGLRIENDDLRAELATARSAAAVTEDLRSTAYRLQSDLEAARRDADGARTDIAAATAVADALRTELDAARSEAAATADGLRAELEAARSDAGAAHDTAEGLRAELDAARAESAATRSALDDLRAELEAERAARSAEAARIADLERTAATGREELERLAREQAAAAAAQQPTEDSTRLVADLDAAAAALRARAPEPIAPDAEPALEWAAAERDEPAAPDCEPAVEWSETVAGEREPVTPGVEPRRAGPDAPDVDWAPAAFTRSGASLEPPAPDAEPYVEWEPPETIAAAAAPTTTEVEAAPPEPAPAEIAPAAGAPAETAQTPAVEPSPVRIVSASTPPPRGLMLGTEKRDYPLLRGAIVKLAHDDPELAGRVLVALLAAQGTTIEGPLAYDLTISGLGTFAVKVAGGRAEVDPIDRRRGRPQAEFHLSADALTLAELLAGVDHRVGRFFGPARVRGRKRRLKDLRTLPASTPTLADAARAGARLDPELVYRTFAYAVHPSWTRGHTFTVAQTVEGDPPQTWYLTAQNGAGLRASANPPDTAPAATVTMTRDVFDRLLRGEPVPHGLRPTVRGDRGAVALMQSWTERARQA